MVIRPNKNLRCLLAASGCAIAVAVPLAASGQSAYAGGSHWWNPGEAATLPAEIEYPNEFGKLGILNTKGPVETLGHPFFTPLGFNGRACVTCHQPADGMSISLATIRERWRVTGGRDPLFAAVDGKNCPHLPQGEESSHSLLLNRGLIRVALPWPPRGADGRMIEPEFDIEVVRDPTGCNTHPQYGLHSPEPMVSVYRRPRPVANLRYVVSNQFGVSPFIGKNGMLASVDPDTGTPVNMNLMADAREPTLKTQMQSAATGHLEMPGKLSDEQIARILEFELQIYAGQVESLGAGRLDEPGGPQALGPRALAAGRDGVLGNNTTAYVFPIGTVWRDLPAGKTEQEAARNEFRESVARGHDAFFFRTFWIQDSMHINSVGLGNPIKRTCATCHGMHMTGMDTANGWMDLGTTNLPWALEPPQDPWSTRKPELPLFRITCKANIPPHPFLGREIYTQDPGRALVSGKCEDVGAIVLQQMRALSARPPYFSNGSAQTLREIVDYYDRRYNIQYTEQEKQDLVNFMSTL